MKKAASPKTPLITCGTFLYSTHNKKILACHATHSPWNRWSIPKGLKDEGEDALTAALRELKEETGIDAAKIHLVKTYTLPPVKYQKQNKVLESFLVITDTDLGEHHFTCHTLVNDEFPEVDKWKWIEVQQLKTWLHESQLKHAGKIAELVKNL